MNKTNILTASQHGYRPGMSTETAAVSLMDKIYRVMDEGKTVAVVCFDMSKAFDCVNIEFALTKLFSVGIRGNVLEWIKMYMEKRNIAVRLGQTVSECYTMEYGVPQGSVLGPFIFSIFINDLPAHVDGYVTLYADDAAVIVEAEDECILVKRVNSIIEAFETWCNKNHLILNTEKTALVRFFSRSCYAVPITVNYDNTKLDSQQNIKYLGIYINNDLSWSTHVDHVCNTISNSRLCY